MTEDLVVAILLGNSIIHSSDGKHQLHFTLCEKKDFLLKMYLKENQINALTIHKEQVDDEKEFYVLESSFLLERIIREWTERGVVTTLDPRNLNHNMYMLWLCLFGERLNKDIIINHNNLTYSVQIMLIHYFKSDLNFSNIYTNKSNFKINSLDHLLMKSIELNRPSYETAEIERLLSNKERVRLGLKQYQRKEDTQCLKN